MKRTALGLLLVCFGCEATLATGLTEDEANQIVVALHTQGIGATKGEADGAGDGPRFIVNVAPEEVAPALAVMRADELPQRDAPGLHEVFGEGGLVPTATEERARYVAAIGGELGTSLEAIEGVLDARVHVAIPDARRIALDEERPRPRASVLMKYRGAQPPYDENAVRALVAGAVQGMQLEDVAVVGVTATAVPERREANLVRLGPVTVTRGSATALKGILGGALAVNVLLVIVLVFVWRRRSAAAAEVPTDPVP
ncbi:MAG: secretion protein [Myxococcota bacterium]